jgi:tetratricopeptide (TPR) repeat protein
MKSGGFSFFVILPAALVVVAVRCASAPPPSAPRDHFPLDPREDLAGPFDEAVGRGWRALAAGDTAGAQKEFARAEEGISKRAATIGMIETLIMAGRAGDALDRCADALGDLEATAPLLVACGEARARIAQPVGAYELYERAVALAPQRIGIQARADKLRDAATEWLLTAAEHSAADGHRDEALARIARALAWDSRSAGVFARAAGAECAIGEKDRALEHYRQALALGGLDTEAQERAGDLALEVGDDAMAVAVFDWLSAQDPRFEERAAEARLTFRIANWPEAERQAARAKRMTRAAAASVTWWMFPEVREAKVRAGIVASDVLERRDSRAVMRAISLGLIDVDSYTHRARPDAVLTRGAAAQWLMRLSAVLPKPRGSPRCLQGFAASARTAADAIRAAAKCGLLFEAGSPAMSGPEFTRGLDRLRSLLSAGGESES